MIFLKISKSKITMDIKLLSAHLKFLDAHVGICLLDYAKSKNSVDEDTYKRIKLNLLLRTKRYAETLALLDQLKASVPEATYNKLSAQLTQKQAEVTQQIEGLKESSEEMLKLIVTEYGS